MRELLATYAENEDLVTIGAYRKGANRTLDAAVEMRDAINAHLQQQVEQRVTLDGVRQELLALAGQCQMRMSGDGGARGGFDRAGDGARGGGALAAPKKRPTVIKRA